MIFSACQLGNLSATHYFEYDHLKRWTVCILEIIDTTNRASSAVAAVLRCGRATWVCATPLHPRSARLGTLQLRLLIGHYH